MTKFSLLIFIDQKSKAPATVENKKATLEKSLQVVRAKLGGKSKQKGKGK